VTARPGAGANPDGGASPALPGRWRRWLVGARPRTLAAAVVPVAVGAAVAWWSVRGGAAGPGGPGTVVWWRMAAALVVALAVQVGANYANDYADGVRGTDDDRVGPLRLVASGTATASAVRRAAWVAFAVAAVAGLALAATTSWWLLMVGAASVGAAWWYTGGSHPYGYMGFGEVFVFAFFGVVATVGTVYVGVGRIFAAAVVASIVVGLLATALLEANNLRDIDGDVRAGKRTLAVRVGRRRAGWLYVGSLAGAGLGVVLLATWNPWALVALAALPIAREPVRLALGPQGGRALLPMLPATARLQMAVGGLLTGAFVIGALCR
jgi:1,4-dihydroxy-2-naphthoate polyprenyltransferase